MDVDTVVQYRRNVPVVGRKKITIEDYHNMKTDTIDDKVDIALITTGGTIDKEYACQPGTYNFEVGGPAVARILQYVPVSFKYTLVPVVAKDSLDLTSDDRQLIYDACRETPYHRIIVSHGTDTMRKTAEKLSDIPDKTIVLFGAGVPERFKDSDASFNFGSAVIAVQLLSSGVYVVMNGRAYPWDMQRKREDGMFVPEGKNYACL